jgi:CRP-like cAMP-binding protein
MDELIKYILQFGSLNPQQIELIISKVTEVNLRKDEYFSEAGKIPRRVGFLIEGVLRVCYYNNKGEEITRFFIEENRLVVDIKNFEANFASSEYVQAVTDCKLLAFAREDWDELLNIIVGWDNIANKMIKKNLIDKLETKAPMLEHSPTERYLAFVDAYPRLALRIPLSYLASYLGMTQSSLSRIRKKIR